MIDDPDNQPWTREQLARGRQLAQAKRRGRPPLQNPKQIVTIRLDTDVAEWFRGQGDGYQTKINEILHAYMTSHAN